MHNFELFFLEVDEAANDKSEYALFLILFMLKNVTFTNPPLPPLSIFKHHVEKRLFK